MRLKQMSVKRRLKGEPAGLEPMGRVAMAPADGPQSLCQAQLIGFHLSQTF